MAVFEVQLVRVDPFRTIGSAEFNPVDHVFETTAIGIGVHFHGTTGGSGNVDTKLEPDLGEGVEND